MPSCLSPHGVASAGGDRSRCFVASVRGVWLLESSGQSWRAWPRGLDGRNVGALLFDEQRGRLVAATYDAGLWTSDDEGRTWQPRNASLRVVTTTSLAAVCVSQVTSYWLGTGPVHLYRSDDGGDTWLDTTSIRSVAAAAGWYAPAAPAWVSRISVHHVNPAVLYATVEAGALLISADGGETWQPTVPADGASFPGILDLAVGSDDGKLLYASAGTSFIRSEDGGQHWEQTLAVADHADRLDRLIVDPGDPSIVYLTTVAGTRGARVRDSAPGGATGMGVLRSLDAGRRWEPVGLDLFQLFPGRPEAISVHRAEGRTRLFLATAQGQVLVSDDQGTTWSQAADGLPPMSGYPPHSRRVPAEGPGGPDGGLVTAGADRRTADGDAAVIEEPWTTRFFPLASLSKPGQRWPVERYIPRLADFAAPVDGGFRGITTDGEPVPGLYHLHPTGVDTAPVIEAARRLLDILDVGQRARARFDVEAPEWTHWHGFFTRLARHGVCFEDLTDSQRSAAMGLVGATLSARATRLVEDIRLTNQLVANLTGLFVDFGANVYWLSIFGDPSADRPWGWQLDGHHANLSAFVLGDQIVLSPAFLGAEPASIRTGPYAGLRLFGEQEAHGMAVMNVLRPSLRRQAVIADQISTDLTELIAGAFRDNLELRYEGVAVAEFEAEERASLTRLLSGYASMLRPGHAEVRLREMVDHLDETYFSWMGPVDEVSPFYYRVHSPVALIEFSHILGVAFEGDRPSRNHVHTVIRTPNGNDYGKDLLRQHLERHHS